MQQDNKSKAQQQIYNRMTTEILWMNIQRAMHKWMPTNPNEVKHLVIHMTPSDNQAKHGWQ